MLPVSDQQRAKEFYRNLGYSVIVEQPMGNGETWLQMGLPGATTSIALASFHAVIYATDNIHDYISRLKDIGVDAGQVDDTPWGKFAWINDPDGNKICLRQAK